MEWKKNMKRMKLEHLQKSAPGFFEASGGFTMEVKAYSDKTANALTKSIIDYIKFSGGDANRINTQGTMRKINGKAKWTHGGTRRGTADVHAIFRGRHISVEIKIGRDRVSEYQNKEKDRIERAGGLYFTARDMPSFIEWFENKLLCKAG
jgi:hypothetical protein